MIPKKNTKRPESGWWIEVRTNKFTNEVDYWVKWKSKGGLYAPPPRTIGPFDTLTKAQNVYYDMAGWELTEVIQ